MLNIKLFNKDSIKKLKDELKFAFGNIKKEFDEHLETINQNTNEIQALYDYVSEVEHKMDKISERLDELQMMINPEMDYEKFKIELTHREQEVFVLLYTKQEFVTSKEISRKLGFSDEMVNRYIYNLISKGIPINKQFLNEELYVSLDEKFKELQARRNVLKISETISKQLLTDKAI